MSRSLALGAALAPLVSIFACSELKHADETTTDGGGTTDDGGPIDTTDGATPPADAEPDVGEPPSDTQCANGDAWTVATKPTPGCAQRRVFVVNPDPALSASGVSIARTPSGRIGIAYGVGSGGLDTGDMILAHFVPTTATFTPTLVKTLSEFQGDFKGQRVRVAASGPDVLHLLSHDTQDLVNGPVVVRRLTNGQEPLSSPDVVVGSLAVPTELDFAIDGAGTAYATVLVRTTIDGGPVGTITAYRKTGTSAFAKLQDVSQDLPLGKYPGSGETSLFIAPSGAVNVLYPYTNSSALSYMQHRTYDNTLWSSPKSLESTAGTGVNSYSPSFTSFNTRNVATFVARPGGQTKAEVRVDRWQLSTDTPTRETIETNIYAATDKDLRFCRLASAVDKYGLEHVVYVAPDDSVTGHLTYARQQRSANGDLKWLTDVIDPDVLDGSTQPWVDLVVDENARPHIAYISAKDLLVRYATRFDR